VRTGLRPAACRIQREALVARIVAGASKPRADVADGAAAERAGREAAGGGDAGVTREAPLAHRGGKR
jgi:hypothetical protein